MEAGTRLATATGETTRQAQAAVQQVHALISEISTATGEQSKGVVQVNAGMAALDGLTQQNAAMVEESNAASRTLKGEANALKDLVDRFLLERRDKLRPSTDKGTWKRSLQGKQAA